MPPGLLYTAAVAAAAGLDRLVGDPASWLHPVQVMGWLISRLRWRAESWAGDRPGRLRWAGLAITLLVVAASGTAGWLLEAWARRHALGQVVLVIALASALAGRSLDQAVRAVLELCRSGAEDLEPARRRLAWIVGRDTAELDREAILRALAETASENAVDGLFAPLFWMLAGILLGGWLPGAPGPLGLAWGFKAASTLDSMLGYRRGRLTWLGTAGARLDDLLVWLPCRLVALTLPLVGGGGPARAWGVLQCALRDGAPDPSPNAGVSQAAYAHVVGVQLGGVNRYGGSATRKPLLAAGSPAPDATAVDAMLRLSARLEGLWLGAGLLTGILALFITKALS
ncbi:adenosylcobinamide-phosphate synthase CbiB [Cyanobium sp. NIES-981]|uniref:adenosylcobinamide-phosphate synthase CbiB n=1 Tax=Cyanobium sp. NIES-981 TaxID=1851505 RepID=UPI0007DE10FF|nr:adenosylcobinamide-phosphate synthase CbiB [Cyanobium sp. NIES-981]SBO43077.1 Cobalamin biosynthesis protein CobD [Cyanobium sp. NIES-981]